MPVFFDAGTLAGRSFGSVLSAIAPWDGDLGFREGGPVTVVAWISGASAAEIEQAATIKATLAPLIAMLGAGIVRLVDHARVEIPRTVWLAGRWTLYRDEREREKLVDKDAEGRTTEYFNPTFAAPMADTAAERKRGDAKPKRSPGRKPIDDTAKIAAAKKLVEGGVSEWEAAQRVAGNTFPKNEDDNKRENLARRVYNKLRD